MTNTIKLKTGAAYIRVSTNMQEELSPDAQRRLILDYAKEHNIVIPSDFIFIEGGISGKKADRRPEFQKMIAIAKMKPKQFDVVLVWKFSRFARNQDESTFYKGMLRKKYEIDVLSISEPIMEGMYGRLIEMIIEWQDEFYSYNLAGEVKRGMTEKALRGGYQARPPLGYRIEAAGSPPVIVPQEASIVRKIFSLYVDSQLSVYEIARHLNGMGLKTSQGKTFEKRSVEYILNNPTYIGKIQWNRKESSTNRIKDKNEWVISEGNFEPILSVDIFQSAKSRLEQQYHPPRSRPTASQKHWLSGLLKCSACGRTLVASSRTDKNTNKTYWNFQCYGYSKGKCLVSHQVSGLKIINTLCTALQEIITTGNIEYEVKQPLLPYATPDISIYQEQLDKLVLKERRIKDAYQDGVDSLEEYKQNKMLIINERDRLDCLIKECYVPPKDHKAQCKNMISKVIDIHTIIIDGSISYIQKGEALKSIIEKIVYYKENQKIRIYFYALNTL